MSAQSHSGSEVRQRARRLQLLEDHLIDGEEAKRLGQAEVARDHFERALRSLGDPEQSDLAAKLLRWIAWTHATLGDSEAALDCLDASEAVAEAAQDEAAVAAALNTRAGTLFGLGRLDDAAALFRRVRAIATARGDRELLGMAHQNLGSVACIRGDLDLALGHFQRSRASYQAAGMLSHVGPLLNNIGRLQIELGEEEEAGRTLDRAHRLCRSQGDQHHLIIVDVNRGWVRLRGGEAMEALATAEEARQLADTLGDDRWLAEILLLLGACHVRLDNSDLALGFLDRAAQIAQRRGDIKTLADTLLEQAVALRSLGLNRQTLERLVEARGLFEDLRASRDVAQVATRLTQLEEAFLEIVAEWGASLEAKHPYTHGHSARVAEYACLLAEACGLDGEDMRWFRMGALLHDVGKIVVPRELLDNVGALGDEQWAIMRRHPVAGVELLEGIEFPWDVRPMIRHHHERYDGTGYPDRLEGQQIPFAARILTVADIFDALTTTRSYRAAYSHERALEVMRSEVGQTLDPALFELFERRVAPTLAARQAETAYPLCRAAGVGP